MSGKFDAISKETEQQRTLSVKRSAGSDDDDDDDDDDNDNGQIERFEPKKKISFGLVKPAPKLLDQGYNPLSKKSSLGIVFKKANALQKPTLAKAKAGGKAALAFNQDDEEDDDEEMPPEAKMRMKNIGRDTPTSSGPNSFGKGKMGFCDSKKIFEKQLLDKAEDNTSNSSS